jgi:hypothetical protein
MEEDERIKLTVEIPRELWRRAKIRAAEMETDLRSVVMDALLAYLAPDARLRAARPEEIKGVRRVFETSRRGKKGGK